MTEDRPIRDQYFIDAGLSLVGSGDGENVMQIFFNINIFEIISNFDIDVFCIYTPLLEVDMKAKVVSTTHWNKF